MLKRKIKDMFYAMLFVFLLTGFLTVFAGCSGGGGSPAGIPPSTPSTTSTETPISTTDPNAINENGIRNDIQQYINAAYPNSAKKRAALTQYAKSLQDAYTKINTETEAINFEPQIIRSLSCVTFLDEEEYSSNSPLEIVGEKTVNTPERLEAELRYEKFLDGKVFTVSSPDDTVYSVCDFDPDSLPN
ncbi:MAG TPA: hypothetical protein PLB52_01385 [Candidatus Moranbacteria bacterium]|mgnify:CR=1 FL=1|nr:hypothetical protein [Candidatus Moranbacteria bacterium]